MIPKELDLSISELRNINNGIKELFDEDMTIFAHTAYKRRMGAFISNYSLQNASGLLERLKANPAFFDILISEISPEVTEMFRDPSYWRVVRFQILKELFEKVSGQPKIWMAGCTSGEELFSMAIILHDAVLSDKVQLLVSSNSDKSISKIKSCVFNPKKLEAGKANYSRLQGKSEFEKFYSIKAGKGFWSSTLINNVTWLEKWSLFKNPPKNVNFISFRNRLIYYNSSYQTKIIETLYDSLVPGGYLVIGTKETLGSYGISKKFAVVNKTENIYKKI